MKSEDDGGKIKPPGFKHDYTAEQVAEILKCKNDPAYFIEKYVKIQHPTRGAVRFKLYDYQKLMVENYLEYERVITMTSRQVGKTITSVAFLLWWCCFKRDQFVLIAANKGKTSEEIMRRFKYMYEELPWWLKPGVSKNNVFSMEFDNKTIIRAETTTADTGRGFAISLLYLDEFAYVPANIQEEFYTSIMPTLSTGGRCIISSTPNTDEDKFATIWFSATETDNSWEWKDRILEESGAVPQDNEPKYETVYERPEMAAFEEAGPISEEDKDIVGFRRFFVHWKAHPDRDDDFKRKTLAEGIGMDKWLREYEAQFVSEDPTLIDPSRLMLLNYMYKKPRLVDRYGTKWYTPIMPNVSHAVVLDPAEGVGGDNAVIQVWSIPSMKQVAEWASNEADQIEQTRMLFRILKRIYDEQQDDPDHYGDSDIYYSVECNGQGVGIINNIETEGEERFPGDFIDSEGNKLRGLRTTEPSKRTYCLQLKKLIERGIFVPYSKGLVSELKNFVKQGKGFAGKGNSKDDRVMSCVLMCHMIDELKYMEEGLESALHIGLTEGDFVEEDDFDEPLPPVI